LVKGPTTSGFKTAFWDDGTRPDPSAGPTKAELATKTAKWKPAPRPTYDDYLKGIVKDKDEYPIEDPRDAEIEMLGTRFHKHLSLILGATTPADDPVFFVGGQGQPNPNPTIHDPDAGDKEVWFNAIQMINDAEHLNIPGSTSGNAKIAITTAMKDVWDEAN
jgi:hypothetical protein